MAHPFFAADAPQVFAHRGGSALAPENTIAAFDGAMALGATGLELDVRLSQDGVVVVHHDARLERTTNLRGTVAETMADELLRADAGWYFGPPAFPMRGRGIAVPTLEQVLARYRGVPVVIELKTDSTELASAVVSVVRRLDALGSVCVGSFGLRAIRAVRAIEPAVATSAAREEVRWALYRSWCRWPVSHASYDGYQVPERSGWTRVVSRRFVEDSHAAGLGVQVWTVDREVDARRLLAWGVDALITDRPDIMVPLVRSIHDSGA